MCTELFVLDSGWSLEPWELAAFLRSPSLSILYTDCVVDLQVMYTQTHLLHCALDPKFPTECSRRVISLRDVFAFLHEPLTISYRSRKYARLRLGQQGSPGQLWGSDMGKYQNINRQLRLTLALVTSGTGMWHASSPFSITRRGSLTLKHQSTAADSSVSGLWKVL